jgi:hypothetical protein
LAEDCVNRHQAECGRAILEVRAQAEAKLLKTGRRLVRKQRLSDLDGLTEMDTDFRIRKEQFLEDCKSLKILQSRR